MNNIRFTAIILGLVCMAVVVSCGQSGKVSTNSQSSSDSSEKLNYSMFEENGCQGVKDLSGNIIIPAQHDTIYFEDHNIIAAQTEENILLYQDAKQLFSTPVIGYTIDDYYISAIDGNYAYMYFFKNHTTVEKILSCLFTDDAIMIEDENNEHSFYSLEGDLKAEHLTQLVCIQKIRKGTLAERLYVYRKPDGDRLVYDAGGNLKYELDLTTWQKTFQYLEQEKDEFREYEWMYYYKIDIDRFWNDHLLKRPILLKYPEE